MGAKTNLVEPYKFREHALRNMTDAEVIRFSIDSNNPLVSELARRLDVSADGGFDGLETMLDDARCAVRQIQTTVEDIMDQDSIPSGTYDSIKALCKEVLNVRQ